MPGRPALDIINDVADSLNMQQVDTIEGELNNYTRKLLRTLNRVLRTLSGIDEWWFLRAEGKIITVAPYSIGLVEVTNGSTTVVGIDNPDITGTALPAWTNDMVGRAFGIVGSNYIYRIASVTDATHLEIDIDYQSDTAVALEARSYNIAQDRFDLPVNFDRPIGDWTNFFTTSSTLRVVPVDPNTLLDIRRKRGTFMLLSDPRRFTLWGMDDQQEHRIVIVDPFPDEQRVLQFEYQMMHPEITHDVDRILWPLRHEELVIESMMYLLRRDIEDDPRSQEMLSDFLRTRSETLNKVELGQARMQITPSTARRTAENARWGRGTRRIDWGRRFDTAGFHDLD